MYMYMYMCNVQYAVGIRGGSVCVCVCGWVSGWVGGLHAYE